VGSSREVGDLGEYFVLYRLAEEGFIATLAPRSNTRTIDILASTADGLPASVQVKTKGANSDGWRLAKRHGDLETPGLYYALVDSGAEPKITYILSAAEMARVVRDSYRAWISTPPTGGRSKTPHEEPNAQRMVYDPFPPPFGKVPGCPPGWMETHRENWDLLRWPWKPQ
jgi:hypothetical protein